MDEWLEFMVVIMKVVTKDDCIIQSMDGKDEQGPNGVCLILENRHQIHYCEIEFHLLFLKCKM